MSFRQEESGRRMDLFSDALKSKGIKLTHQRMVIFQEVAESVAHPTVESVYKSVRKKLPTISMDTVYRALWMLQDLRLINALGGRDRVRFDGNMKPHHHFVCNECGSMRDFYSVELERIKIPSEIKDLGNGETVHIEVKGICNTCLAGSPGRSDKSSQ